MVRLSENHIIYLTDVIWLLHIVQRGASYGIIQRNTQETDGFSTASLEDDISQNNLDHVSDCFVGSLDLYSIGLKGLY